MWELSPIYRHASSSQSIFSPPTASSSTLISSHQDRVILRDASSLQIQRTWKLPLSASSGPLISTAREPANSTTTAPTRPSTAFHLLTSLTVSLQSPHYILAFASKISTAWILDARLDEPIAKIDVGAEGAVAMAWSGSGDAVLVWSAHHLRLSIYRISSPSPALHILNPKLAFPYGYSFRPLDSRYLALAERHGSRDHIAIYDTVSWKLLRQFPLPTTISDVADLEWSPCGRYIAIWETLTEVGGLTFSMLPSSDLLYSPFKYLLHLFTPDGRLLSTFAPYARLAHTPTLPAQLKSRINPAPVLPDQPDKGGRQEESRREERSTEGWVGLGIRTVRWHPTGDWIAVGGWDGKIRILTRLSWAPVAELSHPAKITGGVNVWREPTDDWIERTRGKGIVAYELQSLPYSPPAVRADLNRPGPKMGVSQLAWSPSGRWLASYNQTFPTSLYIFTFLTSPNPHFAPKLHSVLVQNSPIKSFEWQPASLKSGSEMVALVTGDKAFMCWREPEQVAGQESERGTAEGVGIPARSVFSPILLKFSSNGDLLLADKEMYSVAYPVADGDGDLTQITERGYDDM